MQIKVWGDSHWLWCPHVAKGTARKVHTVMEARLRRSTDSKIGMILMWLLRQATRVMVNAVAMFDAADADSLIIEIEECRNWHFNVPNCSLRAHSRYLRSEEGDALLVKTPRGS
jgi:hypothetical protein